MRFIGAILFSVALAQQAQQAQTQTQTQNQTQTQAPAPLSPRDQCITGCKEGNVNCQAACDNLYVPTVDDVKNLNSCITKCNSDPSMVADQVKLLACQKTCSTPGAAPPATSGNSTATNSTSNSSSSSNSSSTSGNSTSGSKGGSASASASSGDPASDAYINYSSPALVLAAVAAFASL